MAAVYEARFRRMPDGPWEDVPEREIRDFQDGREAAHDIASFLKPPVVEVWDGVMTLARWENGTEVHVRHEMDGHPNGCGCHDCEHRAYHVEGQHEDQVCRHRRCRKCGTCEECDADDDWAQVIKAKLRAAGRCAASTGQAITEAEGAARALAEVTSLETLSDGDLSGQDTADYTAELDAATRHLRNALRVINAHLAEVHHLAYGDDSAEASDGQ